MTIATVAPPRTVVLLDLENVLYADAHEDNGTDSGSHECHDGCPWVDSMEAARRIQRVRNLIHHHIRGDVMFWAAATVDLVKRVSFLPEMQGVCLRTIAPRVPDAADHHLIEIGQHLAAGGNSRFVIVSGDHAFADFVHEHDAFVIARSERSLSRALRASAARHFLLS